MNDDLTTQLRTAADTATPLGLDPADLRSRADRRHRNRLVAGSAVVTLAAVSVVALLLPGSGGTSSLEVPATAPPSAVPSTEPTAPASPKLVLNGASLGVTSFGDDQADAVAAVTAVLGPPKQLHRTVSSCVESQDETEWEGLVLGFDSAGKLNGWTSRRPELTTPSGVAVGDTVAQLRDVYGPKLHLYNGYPDSGWYFTVDAVTHVGFLTGDKDTDTLTAFASAACAGP